MFVGTYKEPVDNVVENLFLQRDEHTETEYAF